VPASPLTFSVYAFSFVNVTAFTNTGAAGATVSMNTLRFVVVVAFPAASVAVISMVARPWLSVFFTVYPYV
jgi:hypothetical protein